MILQRFIYIFQKENEKVKENAKILLESNAEIVRQRVEWYEVNPTCK